MPPIDERSRREVDEPAAASTSVQAPARAAPPEPAPGTSGPWLPVPRPGGARVLTRAALPGPVRASVGMPRAEAAVFLVLAPLLSVPVLLATMGAAWAVGGTLVVTTLVAWLCGARRVTVGNDWVADRRLVTYRITHGAQLRAVELLDTAHGGVLRLSPHTGRAHRLRRTEFDRPDARAALATVLSSGTADIGPGVRQALGMPPTA
ncbi:MAG: hypothetical protein AVDCRST_MAG07-2197 [uncultured Frankineae bacterium]|uniref:DUF304 domain-containing protein n=1 Tax=uncultured Frankineae bacterium TaxID=437475 RepID=A0A6J4LPS5_9ACTN|nr:MAG: hypothetical protein AVDCRST_MAG07-2197 [uncultured Frankineae bacterium]